MTVGRAASPASAWPTGPDPAMRWIWFWRGVGLGLALAPALGWPLLLPVAYGLQALGLDWLAAYVAGAILLAVAYILTVLVWSRLTWDHFSFELAEDAVRIRKGILIKSELVVPLNRVQDVIIRRGPLLRRHHLGTIRIQTNAPGVPSPHWGEGQLPGVADPERAAAELVRRVRRARSA